MRLDSITILTAADQEEYSTASQQSLRAAQEKSRSSDAAGSITVFRSARDLKVEAAAGETRLNNDIDCS